MKALTVRDIEFLCNDSIIEGTALGKVNLFFRRHRELRKLQLKNSIFKGNVDFGITYIGYLKIDSCKIIGEVEGTITYREIYARHPMIWYWSNMNIETIASSQLTEFFA
jgi:hypothetical protein